MVHAETYRKLLSGKRILVVDDSQAITSLIEDIFTDDDAQITIANNGLDAMADLLGKKFDLIILDLTMPKPNGWDVLEFIHKTVPEMLHRTIVLTALRYDAQVANDLAESHVAYMFKPFEIDSLRHQACDLLSTSGSCASILRTR